MALIEVLNHLKEIMYRSQEGTGKIQQQRIEKGLMWNAEQSKKSIAGHNFQKLVIYLLKMNITVRNLPSSLQISSKKADPLIEKYATIKVGDEVQKPDLDLLLYTTNVATPIIIVSCKTSLRERAGQTYKWKLLFDLANCDCEHIQGNCKCPINLYQLKLEKKKRPLLTAFITPDFYNEINDPQQVGMFSFFDFAYVGNSENEISNDKIKYLSNIIEDLNRVYLPNDQTII